MNCLGLCIYISLCTFILYFGKQQIGVINIGHSPIICAVCNNLDTFECYNSHVMMELHSVKLSIGNEFYNCIGLSIMTLLAKNITCAAILVCY